MKKREIIKTVRGEKAIDGAGVHLIRVLGKRDAEDFDPFLLLDSFDSYNAQDYTAGFPMHPHRGIETITYLISGSIEHEDSLGNKDVIREGESQWMSAGNGILHQEMPKASKRMLGLQIWLNLPKAEKMTEPSYLSITKEMIPLVKVDGGVVRIISGKFEDKEGVKPDHIQASIYDVHLEKGKTIEIPTAFDENAFIFLIEGDGKINDSYIDEKTAVIFGAGDYISVSAKENSELRFMFLSGKPLKEPIAWGGPIVMNTKEELSLAFKELEEGKFIKSSR